MFTKSENNWEYGCVFKLFGAQILYVFSSSVHTWYVQTSTAKFLIQCKIMIFKLFLGGYLWAHHFIACTHWLILNIIQAAEAAHISHLSCVYSHVYNMLLEYQPDSTGCLMSMCDVSHSSHLTGVNFSKHLSLKDFMFPMTRPLGSAHAYSWEKHNLMTSSNSIATGQIINENYALYIIQFKFLHERCTIEFWREAHKDMIWTRSVNLN